MYSCIWVGGKLARASSLLERSPSRGCSDFRSEADGEGLAQAGEKLIQVSSFHYTGL